MAASSSILSRIRVVDYGVLGTQLTKNSGIEKKTEPPDDFTAFVDPAGLTFIQRVGPGGAGGASASIYEHIGIQDDDDFPDDVREAITEECDSHYHRCATPTQTLTSTLSPTPTLTLTSTLFLTTGPDPDQVRDGERRAPLHPHRGPEAWPRQVHG